MWNDWNKSNVPGSKSKTIYAIVGKVYKKQTFNDKSVDDKIQHQNDDSNGRHHQTCGEIQRRKYFIKTSFIHAQNKPLTNASMDRGLPCLRCQEQLVVMWIAQGHHGSVKNSTGKVHIDWSPSQVPADWATAALRRNKWWLCHLVSLFWIYSTFLILFRSEIMHVWWRTI